MFLGRRTFHSLMGMDCGGPFGEKIPKFNVIIILYTILRRLFMMESSIQYSNVFIPSLRMFVRKNGKNARDFPIFVGIILS